MKENRFHLRSETELALDEIIEAADPEILAGNCSKFGAVTLDSRSVKKDDLFFALKGESSDGHKYIQNALNNGAGGVILESITEITDLSKFQNITILKVPDTLETLHILAKKRLEKYKLKNIKISGSIGKTTARKMAVSIFEIKSGVLTNYKNYNNYTGLPLTLLRAKKGHEYGILELGINQPGEMEKLANLVNSEISVLLNIRPVHTEFFDNVNHIFHEKLKIINEKNSTLIINNDDNLLNGLKNNPDIKLLTYGIKNKSDVSAKNIKVYSEGKHGFSLTTPEYELEIRLSVIGRHNIYNALAASSIAYYYNLDKEQIKEGLEKFVPEDMRCSIINLKNGVKIINDCYNAGPDSTKAALTSLGDFSGCNKKLAVLGKMLELGSEEDNYHFEIGEFAGNMSLDYIFAFGDNSAKKYIEGAIKAGIPVDRTCFSDNKIKIFEELCNILEEGDCVLIKGSRGIKMEEITNMLIEKYGVENE
ncbi:UDP-N-acetylmuramoyl-tripeptide--D-alanyl-D-alanine ligase [candidate division KSB1 bacterium]